MTFQNIPQANDYLSQSQLDILNNFTQSNNYFGVNHVNFNASLPAGAALADAGKHYAVTIIEQAAAPVTAANECALYALATGGVSTLWFRNEGAGTAVRMSGPDPVAALPGQTFLPGGIIMKWGFANIGSGAGGTVVAFPVAFPNACFTVLLTARDANAHYASLLAHGAANFTARGDNAFEVRYIAIGN